MLRSSDVLLAPQRKEVTDFVMPSKLLAYFTSGRPVIACANPDSEIGRVFSEYGAGVLVEPENAAALARAILMLKDDPLKASDLGRRGFDFVLANHDHAVVRDRYYRPLFEKDYTT
jgi:colanic acid biosynthesis glycosyl transferase WcaI